jgi:hypothetical protein
LLCSFAEIAVCSLYITAALTHLILFANIDIPIPVLQIQIPYSLAPVAIDLAAGST